LGGWQEGGAAAAVEDAQLRQAYLALPYAIDLPHFQQPGYFVNVSRFAPEFDLIVDQVARATLESGSADAARPVRLLDIGADGTWSTARLAARGFDSVALDITDHLTMARIYREVAPPYALINVDMHEPVFRDETFDVITAFNALHHSTRLQPLVNNMARMLRPGGLLGFVEPYVENEAQKQAFGDAQKEAGINENVHTLDEWHRALSSAGLSLQSWGLTISFNAIYRKGGSSRALEDDAYRAELSVEPRTPHAAVGAPAAFTVEVANHGARVWSSAAPRPVRLSFHVRRMTGDGVTEMVAFDNPRTELRGFLAPHDAHAYLVEITLGAPGEYEIEFDLVHETVTWFADKGGVTAKARLSVG
jgi:2-polyprenyl-3-methyl-5-hydroxy-6-metoxy-1,4-benzoquinol methylase